MCYLGAHPSMKASATTTVTNSCSMILEQVQIITMKFENEFTRYSYSIVSIYFYLK